jgi:hypothetical protein
VTGVVNHAHRNKLDLETRAHEFDQQFGFKLKMLRPESQARPGFKIHESQSTLRIRQRHARKTGKLS